MSHAKITSTILSTFFVPASRGGGPIRTLDAIVSQHSKTVDIRLFCTNRDLGVDEQLQVPSDTPVSHSGALVYYIRWNSVLSRARAAIQIRNQKSDILYLNSLFSFWFSIIPMILVRVRFFRPKTVLLAPRGQLGQGALAISRYRKILFLASARIVGLYNAIVWHASSELEASEIKTHFPRANVIIRQNEVRLPLQAKAPLPIDDASALHCVFVGRLSPKKGLHLLIQALHQVRQQVNLDVYGEFESRNYRTVIDNLISGLPGNISVNLKGPIENSEVRAIFSQYEVFTFPTQHENFGHVIAESLSSSCPVIIADVTPFTETIKNGGGVVVQDNDPEGWARAISTYATLPPTDRQNRRNRAASAYSEWRLLENGPSVFELVSKSSFN